MRTRTLREGSAGLLILAGIGVFVGLGVWLRGFNPANRSYRVVIGFEKAEDIQVGTEVRYRGIGVGKVKTIKPGPNGVDVDVDISPADLIIPSAAVAEVSQEGLIGESFIDVVPLQELSEGTIAGKPLDDDCDPAIIICDNSRLPSRAGASIQELIRSTTRLANLFSDPAFVGNVNAAAKNTAAAAAGVTKLTKEVSGLTVAVKQELGSLSSSARSTVTSVGQAADQFGLTANQISTLLADNRTTLAATLNNLGQTSDQLRRTVTRLGPVISQVEQGELIRNLEVLSANAAQASANLRDVSNSLSSPTNILVLQQTLDSARATFQNTQKITADLDELTGDPALRNNLRNLINGLSGLVSSTQQLEQQARFAKLLPAASRPGKVKVAAPLAPSSLAPQSPVPQLPYSEPALSLATPTLESVKPVLSTPQSQTISDVKLTPISGTAGVVVDTVSGP